MEFAFFASFLFFSFLFFSFLFSFLHFSETGKVNPPPPPSPNGHARILANAEIYGRSLKYAVNVFLLFGKSKKIKINKFSQTTAWYWLQRLSVALRRANCRSVRRVLMAVHHQSWDMDVTAPGYTLVCQGADNRRLFRSPPPPNNINTAHRGRFQVNVNPIGDFK